MLGLGVLGAVTIGVGVGLVGVFCAAAGVPSAGAPLPAAGERRERPRWLGAMGVADGRAEGRSRSGSNPPNVTNYPFHQKGNLSGL